MKFNKREKILFTIFIVSLIIVTNIVFIYKPMKEKKDELTNVINKIEVSKKLINKKDSSVAKKESVIFDIENYLKTDSTVNYIKKESVENNTITLNIKFSGINSSVTKLIENIDSISSKIYLNNIELYRADSETVECKMQITIYTS